MYNVFYMHFHYYVANKSTPRACTEAHLLPGPSGTSILHKQEELMKDKNNVKNSLFTNIQLKV